MTQYLLEDADEKGSYYVADFPPLRLDARHMIQRTTDVQQAKRFGSMIATITCALALPGKWQEVAVDVDGVTGEVQSWAA